ncbi:MULTISPECIES: VOC family protein [unclassified Paenibacillus]|uniref:VOC family protein n=1 Tax=unclassified Paenibacillus TaxID=185978 RepID=UPI0009F55575|nr:MULTISPECIES: VOC family protein [unclassified Paenibacillus]
MNASNINPFLMFFGNAEEAIKHYTSVFQPSEVISLVRHGDAMPNLDEGDKDKVLHAVFSLKGQVFMCIDNLDKQHRHEFTPAISLFVTCDSEEEIDRVFRELSEEGQVLMPLEASSWSAKFAWVQDKFGVSWQLNLANT